MNNTTTTASKLDDGGFFGRGRGGGRGFGRGRGNEVPSSRNLCKDEIHILLRAEGQPSEVFRVKRTVNTEAKHRLVKKAGIVSDIGQYPTTHVHADVVPRKRQLFFRTACSISHLF